MELRVHSYSVALYLMACGRWPVAREGQNFIFTGDELEHDMSCYHADKKALDALMYSRTVERST